MTYDFSFEKKSVAALFACAALVCALLFFAGVMVGVGWNAREDSRAAAEPAARAPKIAARPASFESQLPTQPAAQQAPPAATTSALPQEPVLYDDPARQQYAAEGYGPRPYDSQVYGGPQGYAAQGQDYPARERAPRDYAEQDGYAPRTYAARSADASAQPSTPEAAALPPQAAASTGRSEAARLSARNIDPDPRLVQEAGSEAQTADARAAASSSYSVQVGAYLEEGEARRVAQELENKGYTPKVISGSDAEARTWYAVRIGSYTNAREAGAAASNFSKQEGRRAAVRPAGSL
jgi:cell division protein FtsN